jgi:hypothetical protein
MGELQISSPFTLADVAAAGFRRDDLRLLVNEGDVRPVCHRVYISSDVPDSATLRAAALKRVMPERAVICRRTAAWLHGVDVLALGAHVEVPPVEILVPAGTAAVRRRARWATRPCLGSTRSVRWAASLSPLRCGLLSTWVAGYRCSTVWRA